MNLFRHPRASRSKVAGQSEETVLPASTAALQARLNEVARMQPQVVLATLQYWLGDEPVEDKSRVDN